MTDCFHCGLVVPNNYQQTAMIDGVARPMCCPGCYAVAMTIIGTGLVDYYRMRDSFAVTQQSIVPSELQQLDVYDDAAILQEYLVESAIDNKQQQDNILLSIEGITCVACAWLIEKKLRQLPGVHSATVHFNHARLQLIWDQRQIRLSQIIKKIEEIGYQAQPYHLKPQEQLQKQEYNNALKRMAVSGLGMLQIMMYTAVLYVGYFKQMAPTYRHLFRYGSMIVATPIVFYAGWPFIYGAWRSLKNYTVSMDVPVMLAILLAFFASAYGTLWGSNDVYFDSVTMLIFFLNIGRFLEMLARHKAFASLRLNQELIPKFATIVIDNHQKRLPLANVQVGNTMLVLPGETIPLDGMVIAGNSCCNEAIVTGESMPIAKKLGDAVIAGSQNIANSLTIKVNKLEQASTVMHIMKLLAYGQSMKPAIVEITQRYASWFVFAVMIMAMITAYQWYLIDPDQVLWVTISVLVVTCPCALSLATPVAFMVATNSLANAGFLITQSTVLSGLEDITHVIFDKTGTLTKGDFAIVDYHLYEGNYQQLLAIIAALEAHSNHPIATAFEQYYDVNYKAHDVKHIKNQGLSGFINDQHYLFGNIALIKSQTSITDLKQPATPALWLALASETQVLAWIGLADSLRAETADTIAALQTLGKTIIILTGDKATITSELAKQLNIRQVITGASPERKLQVVQQLQADQAKVMVVGDGINDVPVLSAAHVSIAMGNSSDLTRMHADAILLNNHLLLLPQLFLFAKRIRKVIKQNIGWAIFYNTLALPFAMLGWVPPYYAAIGMSMSSLIVLMNALRLKKY